MQSALFVRTAGCRASLSSICHCEERKRRGNPTKRSRALPSLPLTREVGRNSFRLGGIASIVRGEAEYPSLIASAVITTLSIWFLPLVDQFSTIPQSPCGDSSLSQREPFGGASGRSPLREDGICFAIGWDLLKRFRREQAPPLESSVVGDGGRFYATSIIIFEDNRQGF